MKRFLVLSLTSFYLLLTTGMFVCIVHCAGMHLFSHSKTHLANNNNGDPCKNKCNGNDCSCCKKHDNFVIKENIKPAHYIHFIVDLPLPTLQHHTYVVLNNCDNDEMQWPDCHGPPAKSGKLISIIFHSLQIWFRRLTRSHSVEDSLCLLSLEQQIILWNHHKYYLSLFQLVNF